jgi:putative ABC transport system permease protein
MELRLLTAALWRKRGTVMIAVLAVAIGGSVACALLHVSRDVSRKLTRELRALGPNLLLAPSTPTAATGEPALIDEATARARLVAAGIDGAALLFVSAERTGRPITIVGADLGAVRRLHPSWRVGPGEASTLMGTRLARALMVTPGDTVRVTYTAPGGTTRDLALPVGATIESGGSDDEAWWIPLGRAQALAGLEGRLSQVQARIEDPAREAAVVAAIERGGQLKAEVLHALSSTEADLLERMRRLMAWVTLGVLVSAGLCAFGTLTDLALERRREIALMKALGASRRDVIRQFGAESLVVGLAGGLLGWWMGVLAAQLIGREVFHADVAVQWSLFLPVIGVAVAVAMLAGAGPIRLALAVDPAPVLKGE